MVSSLLLVAGSGIVDVVFAAISVIVFAAAVSGGAGGNIVVSDIAVCC